MKESNRIYIYGTGHGAEKLYKERLRASVKVLAFIDSSPEKWGKAVSFAAQYSIIGPADICEPYDKIVIASVYSEIYEVLKNQGIPDERMIWLNDHANNDILEKKEQDRRQFLSRIFKEPFAGEVAEVKNMLPGGNHASPIVNITDIRKREADIFHFSAKDDLQIDLHMEEQLKLLHKFSERGEILPFQEAGRHHLRFHEGKDNDMFYAPEAHILSHMIMYHSTKQVIEVGSGFSSAVMLDIQERIENSIQKLTFIEPYPERLKALLKEKDNIQLYEQTLQKVDLNIFRELAANDILFIDSSHVVKTGNDVNVILFQILPLLNKGVIIHFHDIPFPFEYSKKWVYQGRNWNEAYMIRSFLQYNNAFRILFWGNAISAWYNEGLVALEKGDNQELMKGSSLYIQKI